MKKYIQRLEQCGILISVGWCIFGCTHYGNNSIPTELWGLKNEGQTLNEKKGLPGVDINIEEAWEFTIGDRDVVIGMLDTGIDVTGMQFVYENEEEIGGDDKDNDGNGYIDDVSGWDFYNADNTIYDGYAADFHGTYLTSVIKGEHNEANRVWGIAPNTTILPLKFMSGVSGDVEDAVEAIEYGCKNGARIINCSWSIAEESQELYNVIRKYSDTLFVCAAGNYNYNLDENPVYPACYDLDNIITVAAIDNCGELVNTSGYGQEVDIAASGGDILVRLPENDYDHDSGTSVTAAYVSGVAGLICSFDHGLTPQEIRALIIENGTALESLDNRNRWFFLGQRLVERD